MPRHPLIEAIHAARYDLETCARHERAVCERELNALLVRAIESSGAKVPPAALLDALFDDYREFRRARKREPWPRLPERG